MAKQLMARAINDQCAAQLDEFEVFAGRYDASDFDPMEIYKVCDLEGRLVRVEILVCCGGPTVWLHVHPNDIVYARGAWGGESAVESRDIRGAWEAAYGCCY